MIQLTARVAEAKAIKIGSEYLKGLRAGMKLHKIYKIPITEQNIRTDHPKLREGE